MLPPIKFAVMLVSLAIVSACATPPPGSLNTASARSQTSLCLAMNKMPLRPAKTRRDDPERDDVIDRDYVADSDETYDWGLEHNAKIDAACPQGSESPETQ